MRIRFVTTNPLSTVSGGYIYNQRLIEHLRESGDEVEEITIRWRNSIRNVAINWSPDMRRQLEKPADVVVQDEVLHLSLFQLNRRLKQPRAAIVHHLRCREPREAWKNRLIEVIEKRYLDTVDAFIFNSETTRSDVVSVFPKPRPSIIAYPAGDRLEAGITPDEIKKRSQQAGPLKVLFVGNVVPRKRVTKLIEALARVPSGLIQLEIAGNTERNPAYVAKIKGMINDHGLADRVDILGRLSEDELAARYRSSQLLVVPSLVEGFGIVYAEGMAFGLPGIACAEAAREIIDDGVNGYVVADGDTAVLAERIRGLAEDRARLQAMSLSALEKFKTHPTWKETGEKVRNFLADMT